VHIPCGDAGTARLEIRLEENRDGRSGAARPAGTDGGDPMTATAVREKAYHAAPE